MTEDLLAFVMLIAIWKIVQVWRLKSQLAAKESEKAAIVARIDLIALKLRETRTKVDSMRPGDVMHMGSTNAGPIEPEWPEEIG